MCVLPVHALAQVRECRLAPSFHAFVVGGDFFSSGHLSLEHPHAGIFAVGTDVALCLAGHIPYYIICRQSAFGKPSGDCPYLLRTGRVLVGAGHVVPSGRFGVVCLLCDQYTSPAPVVGQECRDTPLFERLRDRHGAEYGVLYSSYGSIQCHVVISLFLFVLSFEYVFVLSDIGDHGHPFA